MTLRVLVVDDAALFRRIISDALKSLPEVEIVGTANNGVIALARIAALKPDLLLLDIEMPEMDGFEVLQAIRSQGMDVGVIIVSAFTRRGSQMTIRALQLGAFDFITKAADGSLEENRERIRTELTGMLKAFAHRREIRAMLAGDGAPFVKPAVGAAAPVAPAPARESGRGQPVAQPADSHEDVTQRMGRISGRIKANLVLIGISTGGPNALSRMLPMLPPDLGAPVFVVQHMPPLFTRSLAESLNDRCLLRVKEAEDGEYALPNVVYIAPGGQHMKIGPGEAGGVRIQISDDPPENNCRPSVDTLFRSAANNFPGRACAVIMTGMGSDGTLGLRLLKRHGCRVIAQDEASCTVFGMPKEAIEAGVVDTVVSLDGIAEEIRRAVKGLV